MNNAKQRTTAIVMAVDCMVNRRFYSGDIVAGANLLLAGEGEGVGVDYHHVSPVMRDLRDIGKIALVEYRKTRHYYVRAEDVLVEGLKLPSLLHPATVCTALQVDLPEAMARKTPGYMLAYMRNLHSEELSDLRDKAATVDKLQQRYNNILLAAEALAKENEAWQAEAKARIMRAEEELADLKDKVRAAAVALKV